MKPKFKKLASENEEMVFVIADAEKFTESRKLADVSNLPTFATFVDGKFVNQVQTNKFDVLKDLVNFKRINKRSSITYEITSY